MFYRGINLISTHKDIHFRHTITESIETLDSGKSVIIFPEISDKGYLDVLEGFHQGFTMLGSILLRKGKDVPITVAYFIKSEKRYIVDRPVMLSDLFKDGMTREDIAKVLCDRCNELGQMDLDKKDSESVREKAHA